MKQKQRYSTDKTGVLRLLANFLLLFALVLNLLGCKADRRVTRIYGKVTDTSQQPVANVQILIKGEKGFLSGSDELQTLTTDKQGLYSTTIEPEKKYSGLLVANVFFRDPTLTDRYKNYNPSYNGKPTTTCCPAQIGQTTEYNFTMILK